VVAQGEEAGWVHCCWPFPMPRMFLCEFLPRRRSGRNKVGGGTRRWMAEVGRDFTFQVK